MDVDSYRIDQVLVTRISASGPAAPPNAGDTAAAVAKVSSMSASDPS
jgi:hypothetical protein